MWKRLDPKIATSEKHVKYGFSPFTLWVMMLPHTDSRGRYWANPTFIKGQCMPLFEHVRLEQIEQALIELDKVKLIHLYDVDGKKYLVYHDVADFNPPGAIRYQDPQWPDPDPQLCKCCRNHTQRITGAKAPPVSSSLVTSSSEGGEGGRGKDGTQADQASELVGLFSFCSSPGERSKRDAINDLLRQGIPYERVAFSANDPMNRRLPFYEIIKSIQTKRKKATSDCGYVIDKPLD